MALLAVQVHSNGQRRIRQVVVRSVGGCVKELYEGDPEPMALVVLTMARKPYNDMCTHGIAIRNMIIAISGSQIFRFICECGMNFISCVPLFLL